MNLEDLRGEIDSIDQQLLQLFKKRMSIVKDVAVYKGERNLPVQNSGREREILAQVVEEAGDDLAVYAKILFTTLLDVSRSYQDTLITEQTWLSQAIATALAETPRVFPQKGVVACQGIEGAYSQLACDKLFPLGSILYFKNFEGVFQAVEQGMCQYGILPIENSSYGTVSAVYDLMRHYNFHIIRSLKLQINHTLLAQPGTDLSQIREIFSHEQALGQCSKFLQSLSNVKITVCENTAVAAKMVADSHRRDCAAISSSNCAALYHLSPLAGQIQNSDSNFTRFICISKDLLIYPGANKISLMLALPHTPGALYHLIAKFSALGVNLTKLESRPIPGRDFEFLFYLDLEVSIYSLEVMTLFNQLVAAPEQFTFLGSYSEV